MLKKILLSVLLVLGVLGGYACVNDEGEVEGSAPLSKDKGTYPVPMGRELWIRGNQITEEEFKRVKKVYLADPLAQDGDILLDYGLMLVYRGDYEGAEQVFAKGVNSEPDRYAFVANYGTVLEINGKNELALKAIEHALDLNPSSHDHSEWIHRNILRAKVKGYTGDLGRFLSEEDFEDEAKPRSELDEDGLRALQLALYYQLNERVTFIAPKDKYIAALMFELGNVTLALGEMGEYPDTYGAVLKLYDRAEEYGMRGALLEKRRGYAEAQREVATEKHVQDSVERAARVKIEAEKDRVKAKEDSLERLREAEDEKAKQAQAAGNWVPVMLLLVMSVATAVIWVVVSRRRRRR